MHSLQYCMYFPHLPPPLPISIIARRSVRRAAPLAGDQRVMCNFVISGWLSVKLNTPHSDAAYQLLHQHHLLHHHHHHHLNHNHHHYQYHHHSDILMHSNTSTVLDPVLPPQIMNTADTIINTTNNGPCWSWLSKGMPFFRFPNP